MSSYITIDGGTTNTRLALVIDRAIVDEVKLGIGARKSMENRELLVSEIKTGIETLLTRNHLDTKSITCVLASGMITSEFGLCHLDHIHAPAGIHELHEGIKKVELKEITEIPFAFIRGVKISSSRFEEFDVMRGEETELMGILNTWYGECVYVLPGSHSKIIKVDEQRRITEFSTMLTGEMISSLSQYTILKDAVDLRISEIDSEFLLSGYDYSTECGINKALFKTRVLNNFMGCSKKEVYSFFLGVVISAEINEIINTKVKTVVIGGREQIKNAMAAVLERRDNKTIIRLDENSVKMSTSLGAIRIFENSEK